MGKRLSIGEMRKIAKSKGGKCLSKRYVNSQTKLQWRCGMGHVWTAKPNHIVLGQWCRKCSIIKAHQSQKLTIEEMRALAKQNGGACLSTEYVDANTKLKWQCKEGHVWEAAPHGIKKGNWCRRCHISNLAKNKRTSIEDARKLAESRGGACLSENYVGHGKLRWQCRKGHIWEAIIHSIKIGHWCPKCGIEQRSAAQRSSLKDMQKVAESRGGRCISTKYVNSMTALKWRCKEGHAWDAMPNNVLRGSWCPKCSEGISERVCRNFFEVIFCEKFPKIKPRWLINSRGGRMELDGYCEKLKLAFEYQGKQHYDKISFYADDAVLKQRKEDDKLKMKLCEKNGIILLDIPYTVDFDHMLEYIIGRCKQKNILVPETTSKIDYRTFNAYSPEHLKEMQHIAYSKDGICLSNKYVDGRTKLKWQCALGHLWEMAPQAVKHGAWCPKCGGTQKLNIEEMRKRAEARGGVCLSTRYTNAQTKLRWQCKEGHVWWARPGDIGSGYWCPKCGHIQVVEKLKSTIEEMRALAKKKGGACLSTKYINNHKKLKWQCANGHVWFATPSNVKTKSWCPICALRISATKRKIGIVEMQKIAATKNGVCLSNEYINNNTVLNWRCEEGHVWKARPHDIKVGHWCPICAREKRKHK